MIIADGAAEPAVGLGFDAFVEEERLVLWERSGSELCVASSVVGG